MPPALAGRSRYMEHNQMARHERTPIRPIYRLVYPEGVKPEHVSQVIRLLGEFHKLDLAVQDIFCRSLLTDSRCLAGRLFEEVNQGKVRLEEAMIRVDPLVRQGKAPKSERNDIIHNLLNEMNFSRSKVYSFLLEHHPDLMTVGKGNRQRNVDEPSVWANYNRWLKSRWRQLFWAG